MSTAAPERVPPDTTTDQDENRNTAQQPGARKPDEKAPPGGKPAPTDEAKKAATPAVAEEEDDRYELPIGFQGNQLRTNNGLAVTNFGTVQFGAGTELPAVDGPVADQQLRDSRDVFVPPPELPKAWRILEHHHLVVLCGRGTGRSLCGVNLLQELGIADLMHLNAERSVETISPGGLSRGAGYLWNGSQFQHERRLTVGRLGRLSRQHEAAGTKLVVLIDDIADLSREAQDFAVKLTAPDPRAVVQRHLHRQNVDFAGLPDKIRDEANRVLIRGLAPEKAVAIAELLISMRARGFPPEGGLLELRNTIDQDVRTWFRGEQPLASRALMIAVAVFENRSSAEVFAAALVLERLLDNPEHMIGWPCRPPDLFIDTREARLQAVDAEVVPAGERAKTQDPMIIRFKQPGRAARVLECVWWQYDRIRPTLKEWLGSRSAHEYAHVAGAQVFGDLLSRTRGPDPTEELADWARSELVRKRDMAVAALNRMAEHARLVPLVRTRLARWSEPTAQLQLRLTAAQSYGGSFGQRYPNLAMGRLRVMTRKPDDELNEMVTLGINELAKEPANRAKVSTELLEWMRDQNGLLRNIALVSSLLVIGLIVPDGSADAHRRNIAKDRRSVAFIGPMVDNLLADPQTAPQVVRGLDDWANRAETHPSLAEGLDVLLREIFTNTTPATRRRISFDIRRYVFNAQEAAAALRAVLRKTLESIDDQDN